MADVHPLKAWRHSYNPRLTQERAAEQVEVDRVTWARWETKARKIDSEKVPTVSKITGIPRRVLRPDLAELLQPEAS